MARKKEDQWYDMEEEIEILLISKIFLSISMKIYNAYII
jgi:hypothetical protein